MTSDWWFGPIKPSLIPRACLDSNDIKISLRKRSKTLLQGNIYFINTSIYISPNPIRYFL